MASLLYDYLLMCWIDRTLNSAQLDEAVTKTYITADEKAAIVATPQTQQ